MKIAAVIVSRKDSKRILYKSKKKINKISIIERKITQLKKTKLVNEVYLGTNDLSLKRLASKYKIKFVKREEKYCDETKTNATEMVKNMLQFVNADIILWAHATNPFIDQKIYYDAIKKFKKSIKKFDSLFSATAIKGHYWNYKTKPINHNPFEKKHIVKSKLKPLFSQNGGIFIRFKKEMEKDGRFIGKKPQMFTMNEIQGWDLDDPWQLETARALVKHKYVK